MIVKTLVPATATPVVYNSLNDATKDFVAVVLHDSLSHSTLGCLVTIVTVSVVYLIAHILHMDER